MILILNQKTKKENKKCVSIFCCLHCRGSCRVCGSLKSNHYHLFWSCPKIRVRQDIHKCLKKIFCTQIPFDFLYMYLGLPNITNPADKYLLRIMLMSAKKTLTKKWLQELEGIQELHHTVYQIFIMVRLTMSLQL